MKTIFFITGTSSGIGKGLVNELLKNEENQIFGYARSKVSFNNGRYTHQTIDLAQKENLLNFTFPEVENFDRVVLINNAGLLNPIQYIGRQDNNELADLLTVNLIAPAVLTNTFLKTFSSENYTKIVLNIGSGAANLPYDGWSAYCSSKSGLHMHTRILKEEIDKENRQNTYAFCILPGIIDTQMQNLIRKQDVTNFSYKSKFVELYEENQLVQPAQTAKQLMKIIENPSQYETISDLRNLS